MSKTKQRPRLTPEQQAVVEKNEPLVKYVAKDFHRSWLDRNELVAAGNYGLILAVQGFDPSRGVEFGTYAVWCIKDQIREWIRNDSLIHIPKRHKKNKDEHADTNDPYRPFVERAASVASFSDFEYDPTFVDDDPARITEEADESEHVKAVVGEVLGTLSDRERHVIESRLFDGETLWRIGDRMNYTKERIRQIEFKAKGKLRENAMLAACVGGMG